MDGETFDESYRFASLAIEMALSRGGDQAVVKDRVNFNFYGGRNKEAEQRSKVRSRVTANSLKACELAKTAEDLDAIAAQLRAYTEKIEASFIVDKLDYLVKGGRCSSAAALGANLLNLKPCIEVKDGKMTVGKKYRGNYAKCLANYAKERLESRDDIDTETLFITRTVIDEDAYAAVKEAVSQHSNFKKVYETTAGCTISCHCGPGTLGIVFVRK